jgi:methyl-accepting chemotaxis protein
MDELEASSRQSAEQADAASDQAQLALQAAENGNHTVAQTLEGMDQVTQSVKEIADKITRLSERTNQIGNISLIVSNLASQTNMLALNAAVEAVRAGEQGRGFSIVALEIQKLADKSKKSTEEINTLVDEIQNSIRSIVMAADEGKKIVNWSMSMTKNTTQAFVGITDTINTVVMYNQQISLNVQQEVIAIQQVVEAMESINQGAKETALGIRQTRIGTENLKQVAEQLKMIV